MKKVMNLVLGGLQHKIFNLALVTVLMVVAVYTAVAVYQASSLRALVTETSGKQAESIETISSQTMDAVASESLGRTTALEAVIADGAFRATAKDVTILADYTEKLFSAPQDYPARSVAPPDAAKDGTPSVQLMLDEGVSLRDPQVAADAALLGNLTDMLYTLFAGGSSTSCYVATPSGAFIIVDEDAGAKFDASGELLPMPARSRYWYTGAVAAGGLCFSDVQQDVLDGTLCVTCSCPVYVNGELAAVAAADLYLDKMTETAARMTANEGEFLCGDNQNGHVVCAPETQDIFRVRDIDSADDLRASPEIELAQFVADALRGETDVRLVHAGGAAYYMASAPLDAVGWAILSFIEQDTVMQPTAMMQEQYDAINDAALASYYQSASESLRTIVVLVLAAMLLALAAALVLGRRIVKPLNTMTKRIAELGGKNLQFMMEDTYKTGDEIEVLAESFAKLSGATIRYMDEVTRVTAEKERIGTELSMAANIQTHMLPNIFPPFPERTEFDLLASMHPAKEVGGDFYDFFMVGEDHLALVVADVSGKGVPAALFSMIAKTLLKTQAQKRLDPARVLEEVNASLSENNEEDMFVTVWLGVLQISTGELTYADAGHEKLLLYQDGAWRFLPKAGGPALAMFTPEDLQDMDEKYRFRNQTIRLRAGDAVFQYTDGVTEATDANNELFGDGRLLDAMNAAPSAQPEELLPYVRVKIDEFVKDAAQFDDITMLGLQYLGTEG